MKEENPYKIVKNDHNPDPIHKWIVIGKVMLFIVGILVLAYFFRMLLVAIRFICVICSYIFC